MKDKGSILRGAVFTAVIILWILIVQVFYIFFTISDYSGNIRYLTGTFNGF